MEAGKLFFTHIRETLEDGTPKANGGATIAWSFSNFADCLRIGVPAKCSDEDTFDRAEGRRIAQDRYHERLALKFLSGKDLRELAKVQAINTFSMMPLTNSAKDALSEDLIARIDEDIVAAMSTSWFEGIVRDLFYIEDNKLYFYYKGQQQ